MLNLPNNSSHLPVSSTRLNFYLAQCKSKQNKPPHLPNPNTHTLNINGVSNSTPDNNFNKPYKINLHKIGNSRANKQNHTKEQQLALSNIFGNESFVSVNACQNSINLSPSKFNQDSICQHNDALDDLMTDRSNQQFRIRSNLNQRQTDRSLCNNQKSVRFNDKQLPNCYSSHKIDYLPSVHSPSGEQNAYGIDQLKINRSEILYSEDRQNQNYRNYGINLGPRVLSNRQNIAYFNHHKNQNQDKARKRVNWRTQPKKIEKKSVYYLKMDSDFKQISNQLSRLTYELNSNSKKLDEMSKAYVAIKKATRTNPQQSLKRANLKYSTIDIAEANQGYGLKHRPVIQYQDRSYRDPRYLIWQPLHSNNSLIKIN